MLHNTTSWLGAIIGDDNDDDVIGMSKKRMNPLAILIRICYDDDFIQIRTIFGFYFEGHQKLNSFSWMIKYNIIYWCMQRSKARVFFAVE